MLYRLGRFLAGVFATWLLGLRVRNAELVPRTGGFLLVANHLSYLDPLIIGAACPRQINFMAKVELFRRAWFAWVLRKVHAFPVKRHAADPSAIKEALKRVRRGEGLLIFIEGARQPEGRLGKPQAGAGFLAARLGVPVVPLFIRGTGMVLPEGAKRITPHPVSVAFGRPFHPDTARENEEISARIMDEIRRLSCSG